MPLKLKNPLPSRDVETVDILGLEVPKYRHFLNHEQAEFLDLEMRYDRGEVSDLQYSLRLFHMFAGRLPRREQRELEKLRYAKLEMDEFMAIQKGTQELLLAAMEQFASENGEHEGGGKGKGSGGSKRRTPKSSTD